MIYKEIDNINECLNNDWCHSLITKY